MALHQYCFLHPSGHVSQTAPRTVRSARIARAETKPLRALIIAGGCWHDYENRPKILSAGIQARSNVQVDVVWTDDKSTTPYFPLFEEVSPVRLFTGVSVPCVSTCVSTGTISSAWTRER